jgi:hypothetical protein
MRVASREIDCELKEIIHSLINAVTSNFQHAFGLLFCFIPLPVMKAKASVSVLLRAHACVTTCPRFGVFVASGLTLCSEVEVALCSVHLQPSSGGARCAPTKCQWVVLKMTSVGGAFGTIRIRRSLHCGLNSCVELLGSISTSAFHSCNQHGCP